MGICMQIPVAMLLAGPDSRLEKAFILDTGKDATPAEARKYLEELKAKGILRLPCARHECGPDGLCTGKPLKAD